MRCCVNVEWRIWTGRRWQPTLSRATKTEWLLPVQSSSRLSSAQIQMTQPTFPSSASFDQPEPVRIIGQTRQAVKQTPMETDTSETNRQTNKQTQQCQNSNDTTNFSIISGIASTSSLDKTKSSIRAFLYLGLSENNTIFCGFSFVYLVGAISLWTRGVQ